MSHARHSLVYRHRRYFNHCSDARRSSVFDGRGCRDHYGTPDRHYPHGKEAFTRCYDPDLFHTDQTMEGAEELIHRLKQLSSSVQLTILTARPDRHAEATHLDLVQRGLWLPSMRLICKPSDWLQSSASFKQR